MIKTHINIFVLIIFSSCASKFGKVYYRNFENTDGYLKKTWREELIFNEDSTFLWRKKAYLPNLAMSDSLVVSGRYWHTGQKIYFMKDSSINNSYCLLQKNTRLYFFDCNLGKRVKYQNPFVKNND